MLYKFQWSDSPLCPHSHFPCLLPTPPYIAVHRASSTPHQTFIWEIVLRQPQRMEPLLLPRKTKKPQSSKGPRKRKGSLHYSCKRFYTKRNRENLSEVPSFGRLNVLTPKSFIYFYLLCISVLPECNCAYHACAWCSQKSEEGVRYPDVGVTQHGSHLSALEVEPRSLARTANVLDLLANSLAPAVQKFNITHREKDKTKQTTL